VVFWKFEQKRLYQHGATDPKCKSQDYLKQKSQNKQDNNSVNTDSLRYDWPEIETENGQY